MIKLSVIIPLYNAETYIERSVNSVFEQDLNEEEFEVIIVNDGSKDASLAVATELAKKHKNIIVINQENKGEGGARNTALDVAKGEYFICLDSDDSLVEHSIKELLDYSLANNLDICFYDGQNLYSDGNKELIQLVFGREKCGAIMTGQEAIATYEFHHSVCMSLFKRSFVEENNSRFSANIWGTDVKFITPLLLRAKRVYRSEKVCYNYVMFNPNAVTNTKNKNYEHLLKLGRSRIDVAVTVKSYADNIQPIDSCKRAIIDNVSQFALYGLIKLLEGHENKKEYNGYLEELKAVKLYPIHISAKRFDNRDRIVAFLLNTTIGTALLKRYYKNK